MLGYEAEELLDVKLTDIMHSDDYAQVHPIFLALSKEHPSVELTFRVRRKDGEYVWVETQHDYVAEDGGSISVLRDVTARKNAEIKLAEANEKLATANEALRRLAEQDGLTGLANRRHFDEVLEQEFRRAARTQQPLAVLLLDLDNFKAYNDYYGHLAGDECLRQVSRTVEAALQRPGDHAARYGGEEFVVLLPATELSGALVVAEHLRNAVVSLQLEHLGSTDRIATVSIGASAAIPDYNDNPLHLVETADRALYQAKSAGRNRVRGRKLDTFAGAG